MRRISQTLPMDGLKADSRILRASAQKLLDAMDGMMWALQNMPDGEGLRNSLVECKSELGRAMESIGYTLKVRPGFKTVVTKIRQPRQDTPVMKHHPPQDAPVMKYHPPQEAAPPRQETDFPRQEMSLAARAATRIIISLNQTPTRR